MTSATTVPIFPTTSRTSVLAFQFSSWYPLFEHISPKSTVIRPLDDDFVAYLNADGVVVPRGSEPAPQEGEQEQVNGDADTDDSEDEDSDDESNTYAFPTLDAQIRQVISSYGAVFPKLNFSSPKDASWILPSSSPLKCTSPMDVYILLKSSDFISHDLDEEQVFRGCDDGAHTQTPGQNHNGGDSQTQYSLELVLRKWYHVDPSREFRCFVRGARFIAITQRDTNYYSHLNDPETQQLIVQTIVQFWAREIKDKWTTEDYTFDLLLTRSLTSAHIIDFNPYLPRTDPLLFTYEDLHALYLQSPSSSNSESPPPPVLRVVDSRSHPVATRSSPANVHNMVPFEMLSLGQGRTVEEFESVWRESVREANESEGE